MHMYDKCLIVYGRGHDGMSTEKKKTAKISKGEFICIIPVMNVPNFYSFLAKKNQQHKIVTH